MRAGLDSLLPQYGTALGDAVARAAELVHDSTAEEDGSVPETSEGEPRPGAIIFLSDGAQTQGLLSPEQGSETAIRLRVPVYTVSLGTDNGVIEITRFNDSASNAVGTNTSYASLSGDYTNTNYSGGRLALLDDRDGWRALQQWWIRAFRMPLHKRWVQQAALAGAIDVPVAEYAANMAKFEAVRFKPRGWAWVDPTKEVKAYKEGVMGGLTTLTDVIAATGEGRDIEDFIATRKRELELLGEAGILTDTEVKPEPKPAPKPPAAALPEPDEDEDDQAPAAARGVHPMLRTAA